MKILVLMKQIPARDSVLRLSPGHRQIEEAGLVYETNGPDTYALEAGLQLRQKEGGELIVLTAGPQRAAQTIKEALAKGADRAVHVQVAERQSEPLLDPFWTASVLAKAAALEAPDLILTGLQSEDECQGQTPVILAELLRLRHAILVTEFAMLTGQVRVRRELEGGRSQFLTLPLPAVLSIQSGTIRPRLATLPGIKAAMSKPVRNLSLWDLGLESCSGDRVQQLQIPVRSQPSQIFSGDPRECARRLIAQLRTEARVL